MARQKKDKEEPQNNNAVLINEDSTKSQALNNEGKLNCDGMNDEMIINHTPSSIHVENNNESNLGVKEVKLDKHIEDILKTYPQYATLYIDNKGGVFTSDTNQNIRGNAILYQNPFHNK